MAEPIVTKGYAMWDHVAKPPEREHYCRICGGWTGTASVPNDARLEICERCQAYEDHVRQWGRTW